ncbi:T9SS type B sorting domain-containing protein [Flavobacterium dankookense]|uniref:Gliding motility-associated-like protein n=1 Tax=Flavobacterium dankookense TaxID=706186 RepID=A0A4R6Q5K1_9FLAO|nr:choice-of-anchor L domain-containing protein [Flavobacterium dankookense]TDP57357.1 gliding motility-associated-like protein [Flavobacterium dankookense]
MKKLLLLTILLLSTVGFSQPITVSSSNYTVPQLVNNVLINSPCVSATNITWRTGTNFGSSNGIGYFQNTNPNFPMQSGVVLSTGSAMNAAGPNTSMLNDGSAAWTGDASLEATLAAAGIPMTSSNASVLEFDFTPISPNFSFDFIFASEEYGNFQCQYSDAFAFLLTNLNTGVTTNLAVVPGTNDPISVITIRDFLYNSSCSSENAQYFGSFNGGSQANTSATNFNGQTKVLTASSVLTPNVPYHIKLVIADRLDPQSDSTIFISSDSFNIGQDVLGEDLTRTTNTALCFGTTHTLETGLDSANYEFSWSYGEDVLENETGSTLTINQSGTYSVTYRNLFGSCLPITDVVTVEYYPQISSPNPTTIYKCDSGAATNTFNLDLNTAIVKQGLDAQTLVTYHASQNDADNNLNPLPLQYNTTSGQTIFVRIQSHNSPCYTVKSFQVQSSPAPVANQAPDITMCARSQSINNAFFNLNAQTPLILNGQSSAINIVNYYTTQNDATNGTNPITGNLNLLIFPSTTIYVRVQNVSDSSCFSLSSFNLIVNPAPDVDTLENIIVCDSYTLEPLTNGNYYTQFNGLGTMLNAGDIITETTTLFIYNQPNGPNTCGSNSSFKITIIDPNTLSPSNVTSCGSFTLQSQQFGKYYTQPGGNGTVIPAGTVITSSQTVYFYFTTEVEPFCVIDTDFDVTILSNIEVGVRNDVFECSSYTLPALTSGNYYTGPNGTGTQLTAGTVITNDQTIYVYSTSGGDSPCSDQDIFEVFIGINQPANVNQCNGYTLPQLQFGKYFSGPNGTGTEIAPGTVIETNMTIYIYAQTTSGNGNCADNIFFTLNFAQPQVDSLDDIAACETFTLPALTNGAYYTQPNGAGTNLSAGDVILSTQTIYIFRRLNASCANESDFTVTINPLPLIDSRSDIDICDQYVLTALNVGNYYTGPNGTGTLLPAGTVITTTQRIYIYGISNSTPPCSAQNSFQINVFSTQADDLADVTECDSYVLPALSADNHYYTQSGGPNGTGIELLPGHVITTTQTLFIYKEALIRTSFSCADENTFTVTIQYTPVVPTMPDVNACNAYVLPTLTLGNYYTGTNGTGTMLQAGDEITSTQTVYVFASTNTPHPCTNEKSFLVTIFNVDDVADVTICENYTLPAITIGKYYTGTNGTGTILNPGTVISTSQTIYIYAVAPFLPRCTDESSFNVTIIDTPVANSIPVASRTICDEDGTNDGVTTFDVTTLNTIVLGTQVGTEFSVAYYENNADAQTESNAITNTTLTTVFVRVNNSLAPNCFDVKPFTIIVNKLPEPTPVDGVVCIDSETGDLLNAYTIYSGLSASTHSFEWKNEAGIVVGTNTSYAAILPGVYSVIATNNATGCSSEPTEVTVIQSEPAVITYEVEEDFSDTQRIIITATGQGGEYEYQLDEGFFQDSNIFEDVSSGVHTITVRDKNGCGNTTIQALVVNYPKFFTPNGDGYHDTWNIKDLKNQPSAVITIYDRYGKILKQLKPNSDGWDGTYNGNQMNSDDYWFAVSYQDENQVDREFRAHFAMKR